MDGLDEALHSKPRKSLTGNEYEIINRDTYLPQTELRKSMPRRT